MLWRPYASHSAALLDRHTPGYRPSPCDLEFNWTTMRVPEFRRFELLGFKVEVVNGETYELFSEWPR